MSAPEHVLSEEERERFENRLRWHFNVAIEEGKDSAYIGLGIRNALNDLARHVAAERERAEAAEFDAWGERNNARMARAEAEGAIAEVERLRERLVEAQDGWDALRAEVAVLAEGLDALADAKVAQGDVRDSELIRWCGEDVHNLLTDPSAALRAERAKELRDAADDLRQGRLGLDYHEQADELDARADRIEQGEDGDTAQGCRPGCKPGGACRWAGCVNAEGGADDG